MLDAHYKDCLAHRKNVNVVTLTFGSQVKALPSFMLVYMRNSISVNHQINMQQMILYQPFNMDRLMSDALIRIW